ncbi:MAG: protein kinase [bacterium]
MTQNDPRIGKIISHYKVIRYLGGGGMGMVYMAEDINLKRTVALKFLQPNLVSDEETKKRFMHEAQAASALDHPRIGTIYEVDETAAGEMFIAMAYYDGHTLKDRMAGGIVSVEEAVHFVQQIGSGLAKAHERGIVHRDVKPANIIITKDGFVKIVDFGLAKLGNATRITQAGTTMGTPAYMSPEQVRGQDIDHRSDIWSLGVMLYELLTGKLPFAGDNEMSMLYNIVNEAPVPMTELNHDVPPALERIIHKAIAKEVDQRYDSVQKMLTDLKTIRPTRSFETDDVNTVVMRDKPVAKTPSAQQTKPHNADAQRTIPRVRETPAKPTASKSRMIVPLVLTAILIVVAIISYPKIKSLFTADVGYLKLDSTPPGALIFLNGKSTEATTPATVGPVSSGLHSVSLTLKGFEVWSKDFTIAENDTLATAIQLVALPTSAQKPASESKIEEKPAIAHTNKETQSSSDEMAHPIGSIFVDSNPRGARIYLNGSATNFQTPHKFTDLPAGAHDIRVNLAGFVEKSSQVQIESGVEKNLNFNLQEEPHGTLTVLAVTLAEGAETMAVANIFIDGKAYGQTPKSLSLKKGVYEISAKMFGYAAQKEQQKIVVLSGAEETVKFVFIKN